MGTRTIFRNLVRSHKSTLTFQSMTPVCPRERSLRTLELGSDWRRAARSRTFPHSRTRIPGRFSQASSCGIDSDASPGGTTNRLVDHRHSKAHRHCVSEDGLLSAHEGGLRPRQLQPRGFERLAITLSSPQGTKVLRSSLAPRRFQAGICDPILGLRHRVYRLNIAP